MALEERMVAGCLEPTSLVRSAFAGRVRAALARECSCSRWSARWASLAVVLVGTLAHWFQWLLPVAVLLYLMIVVPTALWCGFWQAVIVSLSAVVVQSYFTARQAQIQSRQRMPPTPSRLLAFVLAALRGQPACRRASPNTPRSPTPGAGRCTTSMSSPAARCR